MEKKQKADEIHIYKRRLPHWRLSGAIFFITWRLEQSQSELISEERQIAASAINLKGRCAGRAFDF
ncbi:MAG: hypothetical protein QME75_11970 [Deltaproteobacteria bacterium]|nr:hypothetical protein [Deltaproteobacteria bacterium]